MCQVFSSIHVVQQKHVQVFSMEGSTHFFIVPRAGVMLKHIKYRYLKKNEGTDTFFLEHGPLDFKDLHFEF